MGEPLRKPAHRDGAKAANWRRNVANYGASSVGSTYTRRFERSDQAQPQLNAIRAFRLEKSYDGRSNLCCIRRLRRLAAPTGKRKEKESADKPGFVWDNHSSGMRVTTHLKRPTRKPAWAMRAAFEETSSAACFPIWSCSRRGLPCHRVLPPARCALTAPFHPYRPTLRPGLAVCFLLHFPWTHVPQALPGALPWEPGLSSTFARSGCLADSGAHGSKVIR